MLIQIHDENKGDESNKLGRVNDALNPPSAGDAHHKHSKKTFAQSHQLGIALHRLTQAPTFFFSLFLAFLNFVPQAVSPKVLNQN